MSGFELLQETRNALESGHERAAYVVNSAPDRLAWVLVSPDQKRQASRRVEHFQGVLLEVTLDSYFTYEVHSEHPDSWLHLMVTRSSEVFLPEFEAVTGFLAAHVRDPEHVKPPYSVLYPWVLCSATEHDARVPIEAFISRRHTAERLMKAKQNRSDVLIHIDNSILIGQVEEIGFNHARVNISYGSNATFKLHGVPPSDVKIHNGSTFMGGYKIETGLEHLPIWDQQLKRWAYLENL